MKIGQIAEILTMLFLGYVLKSLGWRTTMIFGVLGHAARFAVFAFYPGAVGGDHRQRAARHLLRVLLRHRLHLRGRVLPEGRAASAQGLFNVLILGIGPFVANLVCGQLKEGAQGGQVSRLPRRVPVLDGGGASSGR